MNTKIMNIALRSNGFGDCTMRTPRIAYGIALSELNMEVLWISFYGFGPFRGVPILA
jgi:hypothetical protein